MRLGVGASVSKAACRPLKGFSIADDVTNKAIWLRADVPEGYTIAQSGGVDYVSPIIDLSGSAQNKNASNGGATTRAITGTRTFKGLNTFDYIAANAGNYSFANESTFRNLLASANHTFWVAVKPDITSGQRILVGSNGASPDWNITFQENLVSYQCGSKSVSSDIITGIMSTTNMNILTVRRNGTRLDLWVNGVQYTNNTGTAISISLTHGPFLFHEFNAINEFDGQFGELLGTSDSKDDATVNAVNANYISKWRN